MTSNDLLSPGSYSIRVTAPKLPWARVGTLWGGEAGPFPQDPKLRVMSLFQVTHKTSCGLKAGDRKGTSSM